ncbi:uncharacterized protein LOC135221147 [Macrobrachium nipponense]|uniref:uncharacterized protein LOC135221147 n=1 Tax=Macrobrachium nipponense TaxID=159736 RepID=UPI0030C85548
MATRSLEDDVRLECRLRLEELLADADPCLICRYPDLVRMYAPPPSGLGEGREVHPDALIGIERLDGIPARAWVVGAEEGRGHCRLSQHLAHAWCSRQSSLPSLHSYKALMAFNSEQVSSDGCWEAAKTLLPDTVKRWGAADVAEWMEENRLLIIVEDFDYRKCREMVGETLEEWSGADFLLLTTPSYVADTTELLAEHLPTIKFNVQNVEVNLSLQLLKDLTLTEKGKFGQWCESKWAIVKEIINYPDLMQPMWHAWHHKYICDATTTTTELLWTILLAHIAQNIHMDMELVHKWFQAIGQKARESLEDRNREPVKKEEVMNAAQEIFPSGFAEEVLTKSLPCLYSWLLPGNIYYPHPASNSLLPGMLILKLLTKYLIDEDSVVIYAAGHLHRILELQPQFRDDNVTRCARNLILHMDRAKDRFEYILRVIYEIHSQSLDSGHIQKGNCISFQRHWEVHDKGMIPSSIETLLKFETPAKILLLISKKREAPDLEGMVNLLSRNTIPMCLLESNHLEWESPSTTDEYIKILQEGNAAVEDVIGCLKSDTILSLGQNAMTRNLVCLRARLTDLESVKALFDCPQHLPCLLWLEADFDLPLSQLEDLELPQVNTGLMDVCFKETHDEDIPFLCKFLSTIRKNYSGIHLTRSSVTPQGAKELLKQFYKLGMKMSVDIAIVNRYRRWRFFILSTIPKTDEMTQEKVQHLLGYDDRHHYNDNEVFSSAVADHEEADALAHFLGLMKDVLCFRYACSNYLVVKSCNGSIEAKKLM